MLSVRNITARSSRGLRTTPKYRSRTFYARHGAAHSPACCPSNDLGAFYALHLQSTIVRMQVETIVSRPLFDRHRWTVARCLWTPLDARRVGGFSPVRSMVGFSDNGCLSTRRLANCITSMPCADFPFFEHIERLALFRRTSKSSPHRLHT